MTLSVDSAERLFAIVCISFRGTLFWVSSEETSDSKSVMVQQLLLSGALESSGRTTSSRTSVSTGIKRLKTDSAAA